MLAMGKVGKCVDPIMNLLLGSWGNVSVWVKLSWDGDRLYLWKT